MLIRENFTIALVTFKRALDHSRSTFFEFAAHCRKKRPFWNGMGAALAFSALVVAGDKQPTEALKLLALEITLYGCLFMDFRDEQHRMTRPLSPPSPQKAALDPAAPGAQPT